MTDEQIETALNACMFGQTKADRCKDCLKTYSQEQAEKELAEEGKE